MRISAQLKADQAREGMRVTYGPSTRKTGTLTGETRETRGVTRFKVQPADGGRAVWAVYVWEDAAPATAGADPHDAPAPVAPLAPGLIRDVLDSLPDDALPMTCGTCGHRYADNTPAGRCPREALHVYDDDDDLPVVSVTWSDDDRCPVVRVDVQPGAGHVQVRLGDALIYDADPEISPPDADMARRVERARAILGDVSGHYAPRDQRSIDALAALDGRDL